MGGGGGGGRCTVGPPGSLTMTVPIFITGRNRPLETGAVQLGHAALHRKTREQRLLCHKGPDQHRRTASLSLWLRRQPQERNIRGSIPVCAVWVFQGHCFPGFFVWIFPEFFSGSSHTSDLKIGTQVATLSGTWPYRVSAGTGWPVVSIRDGVR